MPGAITRLVEHPYADGALEEAMESEVFVNLVGPAVQEFSEANRFSDVKFDTLVMLAAFAYHCGLYDAAEQARED